MEAKQLKVEISEEKEYSRDGRLVTQYTTAYGKKHGQCKSFHIDGSRSYICNYYFGKLDGLYEDWYLN